MRRNSIAAFLVSCSVVAACVGVTTTASAAPSPSPSPSPVAGSAKLVAKTMTTSQRARLKVFSPAMRKTIDIDVLVPRDQSSPRPTLYMLDGIDAGFQSGYRESGWLSETDIASFMANKNVNVVLPIGGTASYYTDWDRTDPVLGVNKWETFLSTELPPVIDATFRGNGVNAVEAVSMGATGAMSLAARHPGLYRGVVALSGCLSLLDPMATEATRGSILSRLGNPDNMWGRPNSADWRDHDPATNVAELRGTSLYIAVGNGSPDLRLGLAGIASPIGGALESGALSCTRSFAKSLKAAQIPATIDYRSGLHSWGYWERDLHRSWPTVVTALGLPPVDPADHH